MARVFRWLLRLFVGLSVLSLAAMALAYYLASGSLPDYNRDYTVTGLKTPVEIVRDNNNVPHIFSDQDSGTYFGLGFAHAQDRLWQMTMLRRTAQGRLSEVFGARTLEIDDYIRRLDLYTLSEVSFQYQGGAAQAALEAYAAGVNAWIETVRTEALGRGAPEFFMFGAKIQPWRPADSLAILRLMALRGSSQMAAEILRARTSLTLGDNQDRLLDILPDAPGPGSAALPAYGFLFKGLPQVLTASLPRDPLDPVPAFSFAGASNAWAAAPSRSTSQSTLLANDPHLAFSAPSIWMLARLQLASGDVIGGTIPGMPLVLAGRSDQLGWGITASYLDDQDLRIEKVNPDNPDEYLTPDGYKPFITREITIKVKDAPPVRRLLRWTENGPVLPAARYDIGAVTPAGHVASLSWTALVADDRSMTAALRLMGAGNVYDAIEAVRDYTAPSQNLILADKTNIAFQMIGKMPDRALGNQGQGRIPSQGWLAENRWAGTLPYENNPRIVNPSSGLLANTNNKTVDRPFPNHVTYDWGDSQRIERLQKLMGSREVHTSASFIEAQLDEVSFSARALLPLIARDLWFELDSPRPDSPESLRKTALDLLAAWNGEMNEHMPEPLIYAAWMRALQQRLIQDELGPLARDFTTPEPVFLERVFRDVNNASEWCDVVQSSTIETCTEIARVALDTALAGLLKTYGPRVESWRWGDAHQAMQDNAALGDIPLLSWLV
ncbi:MAG: penicillin acylase family protein, partial [Alphaproteobacteria bacterium]|nr:penicillin acylase family protein [Alphaproteobacteria bacterium]